MSQQHSNEMRFVLFLNDKDGNEKRPDMKGTMQIAGVDYDLSGWTRMSPKGVKYISGQVQPKRDRPEQAEPAPAAPKAYNDIKPAARESDDTPSDDVPF